jgi:AraC-like DNA-binding protein
MPIYMDIHTVPGAEAKDVAEAHQKDLLLQHEYGCKCMTYWIDEAKGLAFCLIEGPDKKQVEEMHRHSHGLVPSKLIEVKTEVVEAFLGRIQDPEEAEISGTGLKLINESASRILLVTDITDPVLLQHILGAEKANDLLNKQNNIIRKELATHGGSEVEYAGSGLIASFSSAAKAIACALSIQKNLLNADENLTGFKIVLNAGEPVERSDKLFGDTIQLARYLSTIDNNNQVIITSSVKELIARDHFQKEQNNFLTLSPQDEILVELICNKLEEAWQDNDFTVTEFCKAMAMSNSQLYRKTMSLWNLSPNVLLKEYRLNKAKELLKKQRFNIAQTTFDSGFSSPSYFTKCFKKKFNLLPAAYLNLLQ